MYYTLTNQFGDIIALYDANANLVASYEYDAWGKVLSVKNANGTDITSPTHIANLNPIRYRGYYYDSETKLYYLYIYIKFRNCPSTCTAYWCGNKLFDLLWYG